ncbi:neuraminidase-like domain-containing protein [Niastella populi]|uniref:PA14 domain-containing protein n=1 Tax=Niastella populi TaxID=550983 RepID=A0A1V9FBP8_9BACT|nr:neuraminidase-like domain-containing protein [Niastella populi]OQP55794.1 hypothetical protein A4R26_27225 [Niastella populi]
MSSRKKTETRKQLLSSFIAGEKQELFLNAYTAHKNEWGGIQETLLKEGLSAEEITKLELVHHLADVTSDNASLVSSLQEKVNTVREMALTYNRKKIKTLLKNVPFPEEIAGDTPEQQQEHYARQIEKQLYHKEPSAVIERMVKDNELPIKDKDIRKGLLSFFEQHPEFNIRSTSVYAAARQNKTSLAKVDPVLRTEVMDILKNIQRISSLSDTPDLLPALMNAGLTSAHKVVTHPKQVFVNTYAEQLGGEALAEQVYEQAANINTRNEFLLAALRDSITSTSVAAIDGKTGREEAIAVVKEMAEQDNLLLNWETLFGNADLCECDECRSVYSASSYLVELLQYLRYSGYPSPLDELLKRRPDIGNLRLTCENAETALPYIDIVNEVMESFIAHLPGYQAEGNVQLDVFNVTEEKSEELLAVPQHINYNAYRTLNNAVYPFTLPYNQPLDAIRLLLQKSGASRYGIMNAFEVAGNPEERFAMQNARAAELLQLSREEYVILTKEDFYRKEYYDAKLGKTHTVGEYQTLIGVKPVWQYYGFETEAAMLSELKMVKNSFLPRTGISFKELYTILETKSVNKARPTGAALAMMNRIPYSYRYLQSLVVNATEPAAKYAQVIALLQGAFDSQADKNAVAEWVLQHFENVGKMMVLELGGTTPGNSDNYYYYNQGGPAADLYQVAMAGDISKAVLQHLDGTPLTTGEYDTLQRFIRLWRKLNLSIQQTDMALVALWPATSTTYDIRPHIIAALSHVLQLLNHTGLTLERLLIAFGNIQTHGEPSMYKKIFLSPNILSIDPVFAPDANGNILAGAPTISAHMAGIMAALQLTADDIIQIRTKAALPDVLSIANLSVIIRHGMLARYLRLPVKRLLQLISMYPNGNVFQTPYILLDFITLCQSIQTARFKPEQLNYMIANATEPGITPTERSVLTIARDLHEALKANALQYVIPEYITAELLHRQLLLVFEKDIADKVIALLKGSTVYTHKVNARLSIEVPERLASRFSYDASSGTMSVNGILHEEDWSEIGGLSKDKSFQKGVSILSGQPGLFINDSLFALFPANSAERNAVLAPDNDDATAQAKIALCYNQYIPLLKKKQSQQLIIDRLSAGIQLDAATTEWLLTGLLTSADGTKSLLTDIEKLGDPVATGSTWEGYLIPAADDNYTIVIAATEQPALWIDDQQITMQHIAGIAGQYETTALKLKAGQLYKLKVTEINGELSRLSWKTPTVPKLQIPESCLFPGVSNTAFDAAYRKLHKAALFINGFSFTTEELKQLYLCKGGFEGMDLNNITMTLMRRFAEYTVVRNRHRKGSISLAAFLAWTRNPVNATLAEKMVALTGWDLALVQALISTTQFNCSPVTFFNEKPLDKLYNAVVLAEQTGIDTARLISWAVPLTDFDKCYQQAESIKGSLRARYTEEDWQQTIKPVNDQLRSNQRNALISYLLVQPALKQWAHNRNMLLDANALFDFFLLDVQMESVMETSRIRQALSSVQSFVQRCFLGLEKEVDVNALDRNRWEWMQQYRTWEANRKVFLYPENWIEPDLRDTRSPFFKELEAELLQQDMNQENLEAAVRNYLNKLHEVSNLDVSAVYQQYQGAHRSLSVSHVFARTRSVPYGYYYRKFDHYDRSWTPWDKIDADIQLIESDNTQWQPNRPLNGNYLVPVVWKNRLLLFWPVFTKKAAENGSSGSTVSEMSIVDISNKKTKLIRPLEYYEVRLAWSEHKNGKWTAGQTSGVALNTPAREANALQAGKFMFIQDTKTEHLTINVYHAGELSASKPLATPIGMFTFHDNNHINLSASLPDHYSIYRHHPVGVETMFNHFYSVGQTNLDINFSYIATDQGLILLKELSEFKVVRTLQRDCDNSINDDETTLVYQEEHTGNTHNRTMVRYQSNYQDIYHDIENLYHPYTGEFLQQLNQNGLPGLLSTLTQAETKFAATPESYQGIRIVKWPEAGVEFGKGIDNLFKESVGTYSIYNWELFFHIPLIIADRLSKNRQYEQARNWFHYIFNPLATGAENNVRRYWQFLPFKTSPVDTITSIMYSLRNGHYSSEIFAWRENPYNPHLVARTRPAAYMRTVVMKYLDNLVAWGDELYRQNTMETINQALMLYVTAGHLLGPRPQVLPDRGKVAPQTYNSLKDKWDSFGNALVEMELAFPYSGQVTYEGGLQNGKPYRGNNIYGFGASLYFNIPNNPQLLQYWDTVADRLFKIRHSMNIDGVVQKLALFEPPIDPALLVRAAANGISISSVLNDFNVSMPYYRFRHLTAKALEICSEVKALGSQLLSVIERRDAEALSVLRSTHEVNVLNAVKAVKLAQLEEAKAQQEILNKTRENTGKRLKHFQQLLGIDTSVPATHAAYREIAGNYPKTVAGSVAKLIAMEKEDMDKARMAADKQKVAGTIEVSAARAGMLPTISANAQPFGIGVSVSAGGSTLGAYLSGKARGVQIDSSILQFESSAAAKNAGFLRQRQDWVLQANSAGNELVQIDKQLLAAQIRIALAEKEWKSHELQIAQAGDMHAYLTSKYTNQELYQWMEGQVRQVYRQAYQLAYDIARKAEKAYRFERGETNTSFIKLAYWDGQRDGLLAGEQLSLAIRQLEKAYMDTHKREYEITKHVSLAQWDPFALISLKETGSCELALPEEMFDLDFPGHFMRRIKTVSISIPCVAGPYTSISATLTLLHDKTRVSNLTGPQYTEDTGAADDRFVSNFVQLQSIAVSQAQHDNGMFELNFRDDRFLPFEGAGAIGRWRLELPDAFRQFDYDTIPDVVFHLQYTAREGGSMLKQAAVSSLNNHLKDAAAASGMSRLFSVRQEFSTEWHRFLNPLGDTAQVLSLTGLQDRLPFFTRSKSVTGIEVTGVDLLIRGTVTGIQLNGTSLSPAAAIGDLIHFSASGNFPAITDAWQFTPDNAIDAELQDAWLIVSYSLHTNL